MPPVHDGDHCSLDRTTWPNLSSGSVSVSRAELRALADQLRRVEPFNARSESAAVALNLDKMAGGLATSHATSVIDSVTPMVVGGILGALFGPAIIAGSQELSRRAAKRQADEREATKTASKKRQGKIVKGSPKKRRKSARDRYEPPKRDRRRKTPKVADHPPKRMK